MPARLLSVTPGDADTTAFHFVITDAAGTQHLESVLTLGEVCLIATRKNYGAVFRMCQAIVTAADGDYESLVGQTFNN